MKRYLEVVFHSCHLGRSRPLHRSKHESHVSQEELGKDRPALR
jgi:hypothetical protein